MGIIPRPGRWLKRIISVAIIVELGWIVVINAALQLPLTQTLINEIRPEKFRVSWEKAWTWYPARIHIVGAFANGQSRTQQWQFEADSVAGSIDLLPLAFKRVWISDVTATNVDYRQRPRLRPDKDYSTTLQFFPEIEGWEMTEAVTTPRKRRTWRIAVDDIHVSGQHTYWIMNLQGTAAGGIFADLRYQTRDRVFSLDAYKLAMDLGALSINGKQEIFSQAAIEGSMGFTPFEPSEHKDISLLGFLLLDAHVNVDVNSLEFVNLFLLGFDDVTVDGAGKVDGRLRLEQGIVRSGTELEVDADDLRVRLAEHMIVGTGAVGLKLGPATADRLELGFLFRDLEVTHAEVQGQVLTGQSLQLNIGGDGRLLPDPEQINDSRSIGLTIRDLRVPDLSALQRYLPDKWPVRLHGGQGLLNGTTGLTPTSLAVDLSLRSESAELGIEAYRFETNLDAALKLNNPSILTESTEIAGSFIKLSRARLANQTTADADRWGASLEIEKGYFSLLGEEDRQRQDHLFDLIDFLTTHDIRQLLGDSTALMGLRAEVSSLAWIAVLLGKEYDTDVSGSSTIRGDLFLESGLPAVGTAVDIQSADLAVQFLDYTSRGDGTIAFRVVEGGDDPDWQIGLALSDAEMTRRGEFSPFLQDVEMSLRAVVEDMDFQPGPRHYSLEYRILSGQVADMSSFNSLLPPDSPLRFTSGRAELAADIVLHHDDADGWVRLSSTGLTVLADTQSVRGDLNAEMRLAGGTPPARMFDISGSVIDLSHMRVEGESGQFDQEGWSARLLLTRGETTLTQPPRISLEAQLYMSDSRPVVAMFQNQEGWRPDFLARLLTVEDIEGTAQLDMANERAVIPHAYAISDNIEVGAKGYIAPESRRGMIYLRYKKADALLKISDGKKNFDLLSVRQKFEDYRVPPP